MKKQIIEWFDNLPPQTNANAMMKCQEFYKSYLNQNIECTKAWEMALEVFYKEHKYEAEEKASKEMELIDG